MKKRIFFSLFALSLLTAGWATTGPGLQIGDTAPDFRLKNVDSKMVSLADFKGVKGYIVIFTCNHCPFSVAYEDRIIELQTTYGPQGYPVIAINPNDPSVQPEDSHEAMTTRAREKRFNFPYLMDEGQKVFPQYGATRTPHVFLLDKDRVVRYIGAIDDNFSDAASVQEPFVANAIRALQKGETPDPALTKATGCTIKVRKG